MILDKGAVEQAAIIAMATHGRSGVDRFLIGSVAEKVLRGSANPLLLVRAGKEADNAAPDGFRTIIVALDGSELAERILPTVADLAKKLEAEILLFRAYHIPYSVYTGDEAFYAVNFEEMTASVRAKPKITSKRKRLTPIVGSRKGDLPGERRLGRRRDHRVRYRTPNALIAMCSHGRSGIKRRGARQRDRDRRAPCQRSGLGGPRRMTWRKSEAPCTAKFWLRSMARSWRSSILPLVRWLAEPNKIPVELLTIADPDARAPFWPAEVDESYFKKVAAEYFTSAMRVTGSLQTGEPADAIATGSRTIATA